MLIPTLILGAIVIRLLSALISKKNEKELLKQGAVEFGRKNTLALSICHSLFYGSCLAESIISQAVFNWITIVGIGLYIFSIIILFIVIRELGSLWTIKIYIAPNHKTVQTFLFKNFRHPNYFLNIIPELVAIALIGQAWYTLIIGLPIYLIFLINRIKQEEKIMREKVLGYA